MAFDMKIAVVHSQYVEPVDSYEGKDYGAYLIYAAARVRANIDSTLEMLRKAGAAGAELAVTNEDFGGMGFYLRDVDNPSCFGDIVKRFENSLLEDLRAIAKEYGMYVAANEYETGVEGVGNAGGVGSGDGIYNTSKLIGRDGVIIGKYRKVHLPSGERFVVQPGKEHGVFKTDIGNIGFAICYDLLFPEHCRILAMNGADMIIHQTQGWFPGGANKNVLGEPYLRVRASENRVYLVVAKNAQDDGGMSCIVDNRGNILASQSGFGKKLLLADIDVDYDAVDTCDYDNYYAGLRSLRARHLLHREPSTYGRLAEGNPVFASELLSGERMCTYDEWVKLIKALGEMPESERAKLHW